MSEPASHRPWKPYRPLPVRAYNVLARPFVGGPLSAERLIRSAKAATGLGAFSEAPLREPLERLCHALNEEANLSPFGRMVQGTRLKSLIINRLRLDDLMRRNPDVLGAPDPDVLVISGLARTGTTLLHRALAADPNARSVPSWETLNPAPFPGETPGDPAGRIRRGEQAEAMMNWLAPDFATVHPVNAHQPEEDILLLDLTMISQTAEAVSWVPSYSAWLETVDHRPAYAYLRDVLKVLNWLKPGTHWVLKTPNHAEQLAAVFDIFPKATILQTHRDPMKTMPSCASLMSHAVGLSTDTVDRRAIARHWLRKSGLMASNAAAARKANPGRKVLDIQYRDLVSDPGKVIDAIYALHGEPLTPEGAQSAKAFAMRPKPSADKPHAYALSEFGLSPADIQKTFAPYIAVHGIPQETR